MTDAPPPKQNATCRLAPWLILGTILLLLTVLLVKVMPLWTNGYGPESLEPITTFGGLYAVTGAIFLVLLRFGCRAGTAQRPTKCILFLIIGIGLAMRLVCFLEPIQYETDHFRYLWDGATSAEGYSPYVHSPSQLLLRGNEADDLAWHDPTFGELVKNSQETLHRVNNPTLTTIYPPACQVFFAAAYKISPFSDIALRFVFLLVDCMILGLLFLLLRQRRLPLHYAAVYWWNPLIVVEFFIRGHMDGLTLVFVVGALVLAQGKRINTALACLVVGVGVKLWPAIFLPYFILSDRPKLRTIAIRVALVTILCAALLFPILANLELGINASGLGAYATEWRNNSGFFQLLLWFTENGQSIVDGNVLARGITAALFGLCLFLIGIRREQENPSPLSTQLLLAASALFLLSPSQFPWYFSWIVPFLVLAPKSPMLLYAPLLPLYLLDVQFKSWTTAFVWAQHLPVWIALAWWSWQRLRPPVKQDSRQSSCPPWDEDRPPATFVIIPVLNEERALPQVLDAIPSWVEQVIVADNGSTDNTVDVARERGALVVHQPQRGYGSACLAGLAALPAHAEIIVFVDGDYSDHPEEMLGLVQPIVNNEADLVIGSRALGNAEPGSLTIPQQFGNALACFLMRLLYDTSFSDLGPFRAVRASALARLQMDDPNYGWTVQMQVRAAARGLRSVEVPVSYRCRVGISKISGTVRGVIGAGTKIIFTIFNELIHSHRAAKP